MTHRGQLTIILATAQPARAGQPAHGSWDAPLCGRSGVDWLLDTVAALRPDAVGFAGRDAAAVRERAEARPDLSQSLAPTRGSVRSSRQAGTAPTACRAGQPAITLVLSCLSPLLQPNGIRLALRALGGSAERPPATGTAPRAVLIRSRGAPRWWTDAPRVATTAAVAYASHADDCPEWLARLDPAAALPQQKRISRWLYCDPGVVRQGCTPIAGAGAGRCRGMTNDEAVALVTRLICRIRQIDPAQMSETADLADDLGFDSLDAAELLAALHKETGRQLDMDSV